MVRAGPIWGLDLGVRVGFAHGLPGAVPTSGTCVLKRPGEPIDVAFGNLMAWLVSEWSLVRPGLVAVERILNLEGLHKLGAGQAVIEAHFGYHAIVRALGVRFGVHCEPVHDATVRKHFLGVGRIGEREATKDAVIQRCHVLGLMPRDCRDDDRADALSIQDYAAATFGRRSVSMQTLHLFGEQAKQESSASLVPDADDTLETSEFVRRVTGGTDAV